jgi:ribonuclease BN (tRNA processing enzyme)
VKLTIVGSAPAYTTEPCVASSSYLVEHGETSIALDFGQSSFSAMAQHRSPETLDAVVISHLHADHNVDLIPLRHFVQFEKDGHAPALFGPTDLRARFDAFLATEVFEQFGGGALSPGRFEIGQLAVEARHVTHIPDSYAFRVSATGSDGPGLVYSGDCGEPDDLLPLIRPGDIVLCEAGFGTRRDTPQVHLTAQEAADVARRGEASWLYLTHIHHRYDTDEVRAAAVDVFGDNVGVARPGMTLGIL